MKKLYRELLVNEKALLRTFSQGKTFTEYRKKLYCELLVKEKALLRTFSQRKSSTESF